MCAPHSTTMSLSICAVETSSNYYTIMPSFKKYLYNLCLSPVAPWRINPSVETFNTAYPFLVCKPICVDAFLGLVIKVN